MGNTNVDQGLIIYYGRGLVRWGFKMLSKKDIIFYMIVGNVIALIAAVAGASLPVILFLSLLVPPLLLLIIRIIG